MSKVAEIKAKMAAMTEARDTEQLLSDLTVLEGQMVGYGTEEQRMVQALISDTITNRHNLNDALEAVFMDEDWFGTYTEAIVLAYAAATLTAA